MTPDDLSKEEHPMRLTLEQTAKALLLSNYCGNCVWGERINKKNIVYASDLTEVDHYLCHKPGLLTPKKTSYFRWCSTWEEGV